MSIGMDSDDFDFDLAYENKNWRRYDNGLMLSGLYGYSDPATNKLNAIGFIEQDISCTNKFINALGRPGVSWVSTIPGTEVTLPDVPEGVNLDILPVPTPRHEHDKNVDPGLIVVCVLVYAFIAILLAMFVMQYCKEKKES